MSLAKRGQKVACAGIALSVLFVLGLRGDVLAQVDWKKDWENTLEAANQEGRVVVYLNRGPNWDDVLARFREQYPKLRLSLVTGTGSQLNSRILAERRAGKYLADVLGGGPGRQIISVTQGSPS